LLSAISYISEWRFVPYVYAVSGAGVAVYLLSSPYKGTNFRLKRLNIQQAIAAIMLPVSSFLMFKERNEWFLCLFVSAILLLYVVFVREREEKKTRTKNQDGKDNEFPK
jgi:hypothetical protein